jgi:hypothetical protein
MKLQTTLNIIRAAKPCADGWAKLVKSLPADIEGDTPIDFLHILQSNGLRDCFWALRYVLPEQEKQRDREARLALCEFAENELHIFEIEYPDDKRPRECVEVARRFLNGKATYEQLDCSNKAARDAANYADGGLHDAIPQGMLLGWRPEPLLEMLRRLAYGRWQTLKESRYLRLGSAHRRLANELRTNIYRLLPARWSQH